jgi:hypothetical protein
MLNRYNIWKSKRATFSPIIIHGTVSTSDIVMFGYVDVVSLKDIPAEYGRFILEHPV